MKFSLAITDISRDKKVAMKLYHEKGRRRREEDPVVIHSEVNHC
jgi:hypothetical protein